MKIPVKAWGTCVGEWWVTVISPRRIVAVMTFILSRKVIRGMKVLVSSGVIVLTCG